MAVKTNDLIINIDEMNADLTITKPKQSALYFKNKTFAQAVTSINVAANKDDLEILTTSGFKIILKDYVKQNGKNPIKYIKTDNRFEGDLFSLIDTGVIANPTPITAPQKGNTFTGTMFSDNITGTANSDVIKAMDGNDIITGSAGDDNITGGKGTTTINYGAVAFGNDTINLTKGEILTITGIDFADVEEDIRFTQGKNKNDLLVRSKYGTITLKNYLAKDLGATVSIESSTGGMPNDPINLANDVKMELVNALNYFEKDGKIKAKYTGTALADRIFAANLVNPTSVKNVKGVEVKNGVTLNTGLGDDIISGSKFNDTITAGAGQNKIDYSQFYTVEANKITAHQSFGDDVINLTKGETLTIEGLYFGAEAEYIPEEIFVKSGNDIIIKAKDGNVILKNYLAKDLGATVYIKGVIDDGMTGDVAQLGETDLASRATTSQIFPTVTGANFTKGKYKGTALTDYVDASDVTTALGKNDKGVVIDGGAGADKITGSKFNDSISAGAGDDKLFGSLGADTISGGAGSNRITYTDINQLNGDKIVLTKGEQLTIDIHNIEGKVIDAKVNKNNLEITVQVKTGYETTENSTFTIVNFGTKDVTNNASKTTENDSSVSLLVFDAMSPYGYRELDLRNLRYELTVDKNYTGNWHAERIDASGYIAKNKKGEIIENNTKGLTLDGKAGDDLIIGSKYNDTLKAGTGYDVLEGSYGDDKLYSGTTADSKTRFCFEREEFLGEQPSGDGKDTIFQGKGEDTIYIDGANLKDITFEQDKKDLVIKYADKNGEITVKNYFKSAKSKEVNATNSVKNIETSEGTFLLEKLVDPVPAGGTVPAGKNAVIMGTDAGEMLTGGAANDTIIPQGGNDTINGGAGKNTIVYVDDYMKALPIGDGNKTIISGGGEDTIQFSGIYSIDDLGRQVDGNDLLIKTPNNATITLKDYNTIEGGHSVKYVKIEGETYDIDDIKNFITSDEATVNGTDGDDVIYTTKGDGVATVNAGAGDDVIHVTNASYRPTINMGEGNDVVSIDKDTARATINIRKGEGNKVIDLSNVEIDNVADIRIVDAGVGEENKCLFKTIDLGGGWNNYKYIDAVKNDDDLIINLVGGETVTLKGYYKQTNKDRIRITKDGSSYYSLEYYILDQSDMYEIAEDVSMATITKSNKFIKATRTSASDRYLTLTGDWNKLFQTGAGNQTLDVSGDANSVRIMTSGNSKHNTVNINGDYNCIYLYATGAGAYSNVTLQGNASDNYIIADEGNATITTVANQYNTVGAWNSGKTNTINSYGNDMLQLAYATNTVYLYGAQDKLIEAEYDSHNDIYVKSDLTGNIDLLADVSDDTPNGIYVTHYHNNSANKTVDGDDYISFKITKESDGSFYTTADVDIDLYGTWKNGTFSLDTEDFDNRFNMSTTADYNSIYEAKLSEMTQYVDMATLTNAFNNSDTTVLNVAKDVLIKGTDSNDTYTFSSIDDINKQYTIQETDGTDTLTINQDKNNFRFFFDVDTEGNFGDDLYIFAVDGAHGDNYESELDRFIRQGYYQEHEGENYREANFIYIKDYNRLVSTKIENINTNSQYADVLGYISAIRGSLASWLNQYNSNNDTAYASVLEAIQDGAGSTVLFTRYTQDANAAWASNWGDL